MKKPLLYDQVLKEVKNLQRYKDEAIALICSKDIKIDDVDKYARTIRAQQRVVEALQDALFTTCTAEEITAIITESTLGEYYGTKLDKSVLNTGMYCNYKDWVENPKLQALLPNKRF